LIQEEGGSNVPEIKHQQLDPSPETSSSEIHIPDDADMGTGTFTVVFKPRVLPASKVIASAIVYAPTFQLTATVNPNGEIPVLLGDTNSPPKHRLVVRLPGSVYRPHAHTLKVAFANWQITAVTLDGQPLARVPQPELN
jgi:hypothetical protein